MFQRTHLLDSFAQTHQSLLEFIATRDEEERKANGTAKDWSAKDVLGMIGFWMEYTIARIAAYAHGEMPPRDVHFEAVTRQALIVNADRSWEDIAISASKSLAALIQAMQDASDDLLLTNNAYGTGSGDPLWEEVQANGFIWPLQQLEMYYLRVDDRQRATAIRALLTAVIGEPEMITCEVIAPLAVAEQRDVIIIDVRHASEYAAGHLPGAQNIPLDHLMEHLKELAHNRALLTYCDMHHPGQSRGEWAAALLSERGFHAAALAGGFSAWQEQGLPVAIGQDG